MTEHTESKTFFFREAKMSGWLLLERKMRKSSMLKKKKKKKKGRGKRPSTYPTDQRKAQHSIVKKILNQNICASNVNHTEKKFMCEILEYSVCVQHAALFSRPVVKGKQAVSNFTPGPWLYSQTIFDYFVVVALWGTPGTQSEVENKNFDSQRQVSYDRKSSWKEPQSYANRPAK